MTRLLLTMEPSPFVVIRRAKDQERFGKLVTYGEPTTTSSGKSTSETKASNKATASASAIADSLYLIKKRSVREPGAAHSNH